MAADREAARLLDQALEALDRLAGVGDNGARHAAAYLRGLRSIGRPIINDEPLLAEVAELERRIGRAAVGEVARRHSRTAQEVARIERRLRRKKSADIRILSAATPAKDRT